MKKQKTKSEQVTEKEIPERKFTHTYCCFDETDDPYLSFATPEAFIKLGLVPKEINISEIKYNKEWKLDTCTVNLILDDLYAQNKIYKYQKEY